RGRTGDGASSRSPTFATGAPAPGGPTARIWRGTAPSGPASAGSASPPVETTSTSPRRSAPGRRPATRASGISWSAKAENAKYTFQHTFEIPDTSGHVLRLFELRSTWPDGGAPTIQGEKVAEAISRATSDNVAGNGLVRGYTIWRFENGDQ